MIGATLVFVGVYGWLVLELHASYTTQAFDFGIFDQGLWLLSRFEEPFVTLRGLNLFGDHASLIMIPVAPLFWLWDDPRALLLFTVAALAAGGPLLYAIGRRLDLPTPLAAVLAVAFLLHPTLTWATWWNFHPELMAIPLLLGSFLLAVQGRPKLSAAALLAVLLVKEDAPLVVVPLATWLAVTRRWPLRQGVLVGGAAVAVLIVDLALLLPSFTPTGELVYVGRYARFGDTLPEALVGMVAHPATTLGVLFSGRSLTYVAKMLLPLPLCVARPSMLLVGVPITAANLLSGQLGQQDIKFQYSAYLLAVVALAAALGAASVAKLVPRLWRAARQAPEGRAAMAALAAAVTVVFALPAHLVWGPSPVGTERGQWFRPDVFDVTRTELLAQIPDDDVVAVDPFLAPHFTHRDRVYMFPNPWIPHAWGTAGRPPLPDPAIVEWVAVRPVAYPADHVGAPVLEQLRASDEFEVVADNGDVVVLRRVRPS
ncbi:MAG: DUF2079 domain-containing protein [Acidimicrobiales bacterium]